MDQTLHLETFLDNSGFQFLPMSPKRSLLLPNRVIAKLCLTIHNIYIISTVMKQFTFRFIVRFFQTENILNFAPLFKKAKKTKPEE